MSRHTEKYISIAKLISKYSHAKRLKVGCIIVKDNAIISDGYNGTPKGFDNCCEDIEGKTLRFVLHAEANAITKAAKSTISTVGATLYCTHSPCLECSKLIIQSGIASVIYIDKYRDNLGLYLLLEAGVVVERFKC